MKDDRGAWKKIEHWLVIVIFIFTTAGALLMYLFSDELDMVRGASNGDESQYECRAPRGPC